MQFTYFARDDLALPGFADFFSKTAAKEWHHGVSRERKEIGEKERRRRRRTRSIINLNNDTDPLGHLDEVPDHARGSGGAAGHHQAHHHRVGHSPAGLGHCPRPGEEGEQDVDGVSHTKSRVTDQNTVHIPLDGPVSVGATDQGHSQGGLPLGKLRAGELPELSCKRDDRDM